VPRPKLRTDELRVHVLGVALRMLETDGVAHFTARRLAEEAGTSMPAVYELFGDKAGVVRALFFEGFRMLRERLETLPSSADPRADLERLLELLRAFARAHPVLAEVMFSRPFVDFDPGRSELKAGSGVRKLILGRVKRTIDAGSLVGDEVDIAHVLLALVQGLAAQERAGWLGTSQAAVERRWKLAFRAALDGLGPRRASP
jgi:AcrR family transcriptional regulator